MSVEELDAATIDRMAQGRIRSREFMEEETKRVLPSVAPVLDYLADICSGENPVEDLRTAKAELIRSKDAAEAAEVKPGLFDVDFAANYAAVGRLSDVWGTVFLFLYKAGTENLGMAEVWDRLGVEEPYVPFDGERGEIADQVRNGAVNRVLPFFAPILRRLVQMCYEEDAISQLDDFRDRVREAPVSENGSDPDFLTNAMAAMRIAEVLDAVRGRAGMMVEGSGLEEVLRILSCCGRESDTEEGG